MNTRVTWAQARRARRERSGCLQWSTLPEACIIVLCGATGRTALPVASIVGTLLSVVNQGAVIAGGDGTSAAWWRVAFNYAVPFVVSTIGFLAAGRGRGRSGSCPSV